MRGRWRRALVWAACLSAAPIAGEIAVRVGVITPPRAIITGHDLRLEGGVPVWRGDDPAPRENRACAEAHPERTRVAFFGASVTYGDEVKADETFATLLEQRLNAARPNPGFCVLNFSSPGFLHEQREVTARRELPRYKPQIAFFQDADEEWLGSRYKLLGDMAYDVGTLALRPDGFPGVPGVPDAANRFLFLHSQLYRYLVLARGAGDPSGPLEALPGIAGRRAAAASLASLARAAGSLPVFLAASDVVHASNQPEFETTIEQPLVDFGRQEGIPVHILHRELNEPEDRALHVDFRHFNASGHRLVAEHLETVVLDLLDHPNAKAPVERGPK